MWLVRLTLTSTLRHVWIRSICCASSRRRWGYIRTTLSVRTAASAQWHSNRLAWTTTNIVVVGWLQNYVRLLICKQFPCEFLMWAYVLLSLPQGLLVITLEIWSVQSSQCPTSLHCVRVMHVPHMCRHRGLYHLPVKCTYPTYYCQFTILSFWYTTARVISLLFYLDFVLSDLSFSLSTRVWQIVLVRFCIHSACSRQMSVMASCILSAIAELSSWFTVFWFHFMWHIVLSCTGVWKSPSHSVWSQCRHARCTCGTTSDVLCFVIRRWSVSINVVSPYCAQLVLDRFTANDIAICDQPFCVKPLCIRCIRGTTRSFHGLTQSVSAKAGSKQAHHVNC